MDTTTTQGFKSRLAQNVNIVHYVTLQLLAETYLLSRQVTLIGSHSARYFAEPLVARKLKYRSAPEPYVFIVHFDICCAQNKLSDLFHNDKYQRVKEFHMLARIGCYCKIMVFSTFKLQVTYYHSSKGNK